MGKRVVRITYLTKTLEVDEGGILQSLIKLGHEVTHVYEQSPHILKTQKTDFLLFHKPRDLSVLDLYDGHKVFWYFDRVNWFQIKNYAKGRLRWMADATPKISLGFCTDGDWVNQDQTGKLINLKQGCREDTSGPGVGPKDYDIVFVGGVWGNPERQLWVDFLESNFGDKFHHIGETDKVYGRDLANVIAKSKIVVAPNSPISDHYWSNRVYNMLGYKAFLLHPYCKDLTDHYTHCKDLVYYDSLQDLKDKIEIYLDLPDTREKISQSGYERTLKEHTYQHRVKTLCDIVQERLHL